MSKPAEIHLGTITLPLLDYAVGAAAVLGIRDSGKTVTCKGIAEQLMDHKIPVIVFDAVGKWRFLKVAGEKANDRGYKIVVVGGREPDLPLTKESIVEVIRAALKERISLVVDLFDPKLSKADWKTIVKAAIKTIHYENDGSPIHVFLEESAEFVPQRVIDGDVYAEIEKLVRMGGNNGVGITLINQRSQEVNKAVLEQCTTLILGCQIGSRAIEAVEKWVERLDEKTSEEVTTHLPKLRAGEAYVWTRQNPEKPTCQKFPMCRSYHPDRRTQTAAFKNIGHAITDTSDFVERMAAAIPKVIEQAKAKDPKALHSEIDRLKRQLYEMEGRVHTKEVAVPVFDEKQQGILKAVANNLDEGNKLLAGMAELLASIQPRAAAPHVPTFPVQNYFLNEQHTTHVSKNQVRRERQEGNGILSGGTMKIMNAIAQRQGVDRDSLKTLTGYRTTSVNVYTQQLKRDGYVTEEGRTLYPTEAGIKALGSNFQPLPQGRELIAHYQKELPEGEARIFNAIVQNHELNREQIREITGYKTTSVNVYVQALKRRRCLVENGRLLSLAEEMK